MPDIFLHAQEIIQVADDPVSGQAGPRNRAAVGACVAQSEEGALAGSNLFEPLHIVDRLLKALDQNVLEGIVKIAFDRGLVPRIGFNVVCESMGRREFLSGQVRGEEFLHPFGVVAPPSLHLLQRRVPVLHKAVLLLDLHNLVGNLLDALSQRGGAALRLLVSCGHCPLA